MHSPPTKALKLIPVGNSTGVVLPKELLAGLGLERGDEVYPVNTPNGIELRKFDPEIARQLEAGRRIMKKRRSALRELAK
ncbi:MAG: AbrB/MazE/SpoVT family DNA-binding domain-containing protein [Pseudomonadota bacterium]